MLGIAFVSGATAIFGLVYLLSTALGVSHLPADVRVSLGAAGLLMLAAIDLRAIRKSTYCRLSWLRQTPKAIAHRRSVTTVAAAWGFDTGLAVTTVRVAAITWGAFLLVGLGLSTWFTGIGYGLGFTLPFLTLLWTHRVGRLARAPGPVDPGLERMLDKRKTMQALSGAILTAGAAMLITSIVLT